MYILINLNKAGSHMCHLWIKEKRVGFDDIKKKSLNI